ncbi:phage tail protein [Lactiplantibacillus plantarum]|nr:phage tail protein [Lactiplantibacillus plantarum]MCG0618715.1 phage tail protein [Lactiplantibacillus plantarum]MCG0807135.1 phage tail protein [Lactiplantibacillus plantarum]MCG0832024.1 phage tail protein [Lactiplantibacillus plantarum]MCG0850851.1 phage tail protein [Lactiplantibacillus plantarum]
MAESNATQVILTDDGLKIIHAQGTADNAVKGITNLNDPNLMSVIEKQNNIGQFAGLTSQYNVIVQNAKDDGIDTTAITAAYNSLNSFMAGALADPDHASDVDRVTYKKYQDTYNEELTNLQNALQNNTNNKFASAASATSQAASTASQAFSQAQAVNSQADSEMAVQSMATYKAQSTADSAFSQAKTAIDTGQAVSQAVTALKDGSTLTIAELGSGVADKISKSEYASYQYQTASQIGELVTDGAFSAYSQATAKLISATVATSDFDSYKDQTAKDISSKVESKDFKDYQQQTADAFKRTISTTDFDNLTISNRNLALGTATPIKIVGQNINNQAQVGYGFSKVIPRGTVVTATFDVSSSTGVGNFVVQFYGGDSGSSWQNISSGNLVNGTKHVSATITTDSDQLHMYPILDNATGDVAFSNFIISESSKEVGWTLAPEDQATQSEFTQLKDNIDLRVEKKGLIAEINMQAGNTLISTSGQLTLSGKNINFDTDNPVTIPSANIDKLLVDKQLKAADISANTFSTNNGTFMVEKNGAITAKNMTLIGGTLTSPTINTSTINGSTVNGTTFHGGDIINDANNTSKLYPTTISSDGHIYTTWFNPVDAMQTDLSTGALTTKYRAINTTNPNNHYEAYDTTLQADQIALFAGYTNGKDMSFTQSVTGSNQEGYVLISPLDGLTLHGDNQQITFNGTSDDVTPKGIFITPYGNINPNGTQNIWYVGNNMAMKTAQFGIDANNEFGVDLFRPTFVDEIGAMGNRLPNGRLFLHATDNNAQMYLLNDGKPAFVSPTIYNRTYSNGANMFVTSSGRVGRSTSASKYKLAIARSDDTLQADRLMTLNLASWNDKVATEKMAESLSNGEIPVEAEINLKRHYGLIAEDLRDAGLDEFLITGKDGQIEGIEYDRLWTVLIPKIKQLNNRINELERKTL